MDTTRAPMMAMTMVGGDHFFLRRWVDYYGGQLGRENCYVLSHGGDPEHQKIAEGCNIIYLPFDPTRNCFNQRRWQMLSRVASGFLQFYNWVLVGDVDELVVVDPAISPSLRDYVTAYNPKKGPKVLTPFAIEMVHTPDLEPEPITDGRNILQVRRNFRLNANYAKPCITSTTIDIVPGGHFASHPQLHLDPHLYLFHLRFIDYDLCAARLATRRAQRDIQSGSLEEVSRQKTGWDTAWDTYISLCKEKPIREDVEFADFRAEMRDGWKPKKVVYWAPGGARPKGLYSLPERFASVF
ncbi:MAG: glycosyltransferase family 2 protein [Cypionkella sp.]|nr:glycosyltransferase family 2 protein [Cypionkella sp.]